jgi:hypothetical protein
MVIDCSELDRNRYPQVVALERESGWLRERIAALCERPR